MPDASCQHRSHQPHRRRCGWLGKWLDDFEPYGMSGIKKSSAEFAQPLSLQGSQGSLIERSMGLLCSRACFTRRDCKLYIHIHSHITEQFSLEKCHHAPAFERQDSCRCVAEAFAGDHKTVVGVVKERPRLTNHYTLFRWCKIARRWVLRSRVEWFCLWSLNNLVCVLYSRVGTCWCLM